MPRRYHVINLDAGVQITARDGDRRVISAAEVILVREARSREASAKTDVPRWDSKSLSSMRDGIHASASTTPRCHGVL